MMKVLLFTLFLASSLCLQAQVRIDGSFSEWESLLAAGYQETAEEFSGPDLSAVAVTNDEEFVYFYLQADKPFKLHDNEYWMNPASVYIYLDIDLDASTGDAISGIGADLIIDTGNKMIIYVNETGNTYFTLNELGLVSLPTATSAEYEIALSRKGLPDISSPLFSKGAFNYVIREINSSDLLPNEGFLTYTLQEDLQQNYTPIPLEPQQLEEPQLRLLTHNVLHDGLIVDERSDKFARIYQALQPDILTLNENWDTTPEEAKSFFDTHLSLSSPHGWYTSKIVYGNMTISKYPIVKTWEVYEGQRMAASLIDLPDSLFPRDLLVINSHLRCCDEDDIRQDEVDALVAFILDAKTAGDRIDLPANTPIAISGDLNLVGDSQQLRTILSGDIQNTNEFGAGGAPDWDGSTLTDLRPLHSDYPFAYTWYNPTSDYPAGRMDFIIYTDNTLQVQNSFILNILETPTEKLSAYGLSLADAEASDHLPLVADFTMDGCNSTPTATVSFSGLPDTVVLSTPAISLTGQPAGGEFWGAGIENSTFNPSTAGLGVYTIKYTIWNEEGCSSSVSQKVVVRECSSDEIPDASFSGLPDSLLTTDSPVNLTATTSGGTFSGKGVSGSIFDPSVAGAGTFEIIYTIQNEKGCSNTASQQVVVTQSAPTGIQDPLLENLSLIPNPASSHFRILLPETPSEPVIMSIYTAEGKRMMQQELNRQKTVISLENLPGGLLFIQMNTRKGQKAYRLLKENR